MTPPSTTINGSLKDQTHSISSIVTFRRVDCMMKVIIAASPHLHHIPREEMNDCR
jgi:hypothetical protein